jgi:hypothetical protein
LRDRNWFGHVIPSAVFDPLLSRVGQNPTMAQARCMRLSIGRVSSRAFPTPQPGRGGFCAEKHAANEAFRCGMAGQMGCRWPADGLGRGLAVGDRR